MITEVTLRAVLCVDELFVEYPVLLICFYFRHISTNNQAQQSRLEAATAGLISIFCYDNFQFTRTTLSGTDNFTP